LRGRCVQPCRRRYTWSGKGKGKAGAQGGYLFSMNDLSGIELIPQLRQVGVTSLKLEGRMRSASYVGAVTSAYRMAIDASPDDSKTLAIANERLREAMGRSSTSGYFPSSQPVGAISPQHSGNIGLYLGRVDASKDKSAQFVLKEPLRCGDRLRLHQEKSGERLAFTLKSMFKKGVEVDVAEAGSAVSIELPETAQIGDSLYKVDTCARRGEGAKDDHVKPELFAKQAADPAIRKKSQLVLDALRADGILSLVPQEDSMPVAVSPAKGGKGGKGGKGVKGSPSVRVLRWWLKVDDFGLLRRNMPDYPDRIVVTLTPQTLSQFRRSKRLLDQFIPNMVWALPPIITEENLSFYRRSIGELRRGGFCEWQVGHIGQLGLFQMAPVQRRTKKGKLKKRPPRRTPRLILCGDYTLNILNSLSLRCLGSLGLSKAQCSIESDRDNLRALLRGSWKGETGFTIYGSPPLFVARLKSKHFQYDRPFQSPRGESFMLKEAWGQTVAVADPVFSLLGYQTELAGMGLRYGVVDISLLRLRKGDLEQLAAQAAGKVAKPSRQRTSTFNYLGTLL
ncbi:MAG: U32 family peptidase, partial [Desulfobulbaceae bacterium]|nr:U32 family peptidase [Desulfobulbaceae bacterium]